MSNQKQANVKFKFKYVIPENLRDLYVNGLWGGITPRNEIHIQFYNERHPIPNSLTCAVDEKGQIGELVEHDIGGDVVRVIQTSIVMDYPTAVSVRNWLNERIDHIEKSFQKSEEGK